MIDAANGDTAVRTPPATPRNIFTALAVGTIGGILFNLLSLPLPWMLGAMAGASVCAIGGVPLGTSRHLRSAMIAVIGVLLGSGFSPAIFTQVVQWVWTVSILAVFLAGLASLVPLALHRLGYDWATAYFSALPAGLTEMTAIGMDKGGDAQIIALTHTVRILLVAFGIPATMVLLAGYERPVQSGPGMNDLAALDVTILMGCAVAGLWLGHRLRLPAAALAGPLILSALAHVSGLTRVAPPATVVSIAQIVLGTSVGARFSGLTWGKSGRTVVIAAAMTLVMLLLSGAIAATLGPILGIDPVAMLLALTPGGVTEMSLIALALQQDIAFVTTHHVIRIALIVMIGPAIFVAAKAAFDRAAAASTSKSPE